MRHVFLVNYSVSVSLLGKLKRRNLQCKTCISPPGVSRERRARDVCLPQRGETAVFTG